MGRGELPEPLVGPTRMWNKIAAMYSTSRSRDVLEPRPGISTRVDVLGEIQTGTEISTTLESVAVATTLAVPLGLVSALIADLGFELGVDAVARSLLPIATMAVGTAGFSLIAAGLTVLWKRIARRNGSLAHY